MGAIAIIEGGKVKNVVVGELADFPGGVLLTGGLVASPGDLWNGTAFTPSSPILQPRAWTELAFYLVLTAAERNALRVAAAVKDEAVLSDCVAMLAAYGRANQAVPEGDPDMVLWLNAMVAKGVLGAAKAKDLKEGKI